MYATAAAVVEKGGGDDGGLPTAVAGDVVVGKHRGTAAGVERGMDTDEIKARSSYLLLCGEVVTYAAQGDDDIAAAVVAEDDGRSSPDLSSELDAAHDDDEVVIHP